MDVGTYLQQQATQHGPLVLLLLAMYLNQLRVNRNLEQKLDDHLAKFEPPAPPEKLQTDQMGTIL